MTDKEELATRIVNAPDWSGDQIIKFAIDRCKRGVEETTEFIRKTITRINTWLTQLTMYYDGKITLTKYEFREVIEKITSFATDISEAQNDIERLEEYIKRLTAEEEEA